jgi:hypothetical protein
MGQSGFSAPVVAFECLTQCAKESGLAESIDFILIPKCNIRFTWDWLG